MESDPKEKLQDVTAKGGGSGWRELFLDFYQICDTEKRR